MKNSMRGFGYIGLLVTLALVAVMMSVGYSSLLSSKNTTAGDATTQERGIGAIHEANEAKRLLEEQSSAQLKIQQQLLK
ncbi:MAG: hypothetical protein AAB552_03220 [Patescibacteria group bacterium]